jgi:hypothetical protein
MTSSLDCDIHMWTVQSNPSIARTENRSFIMKAVPTEFQSVLFVNCINASCGLFLGSKSRSTKHTMKMPPMLTSAITASKQGSHLAKQVLKRLAKTRSAMINSVLCQFSGVYPGSWSVMRPWMQRVQRDAIDTIPDVQPIEISHPVSKDRYRSQLLGANMLILSMYGLSGVLGGKRSLRNIPCVLSASCRVL